MEVLKRSRSAILFCCGITRELLQTMGLTADSSKQQHKTRPLSDRMIKSIKYKHPTSL